MDFFCSLLGFKGTYCICTYRLRQKFIPQYGWYQDQNIQIWKKNSFNIFRTHSRNVICLAVRKKLPHKLWWKYELTLKLKLLTKTEKFHVENESKQLESFPDVRHQCAFSTFRCRLKKSWCVSLVSFLDLIVGFFVCVVSNRFPFFHDTFDFPVATRS